MTDTTTVPASKPFYMSMTLWGIVVSGIGILLPNFGIPFGPEIQGAAIELVQSIISSAGLVLAFIGRLRAKTVVTASKAPAAP